MEIIYRTAAASDAAELLNYLKVVGSETDNLTFGKEGIPFTVQQEEALLERISKSAHSRFFLAMDGDKIVGNACVDGNGNPRFLHRRSLAITVLKDYWGRGIGSGLMERMIAFSRKPVQSCFPWRFGRTTSGQKPCIANSALPPSAPSPSILS